MMRITSIVNWLIKVWYFHKFKTTFDAKRIQNIANKLIDNNNAGLLTSIIFSSYSHALLESGNCKRDYLIGPIRDRNFASVMSVLWQIVNAEPKGRNLYEKKEKRLLAAMLLAELNWKPKNVTEMEVYYNVYPNNIVSLACKSEVTYDYLKYLVKSGEYIYNIHQLGKEKCTPLIPFLVEQMTINPNSYIGKELKKLEWQANNKYEQISYFKSLRDYKSLAKFAQEGDEEIIEYFISLLTSKTVTYEWKDIAEIVSTIGKGKALIATELIYRLSKFNLDKSYFQKSIVTVLQLKAQGKDYQIVYERPVFVDCDNSEYETYAELIFGKYKISSPERFEITSL